MNHPATEATGRGPAPSRGARANGSPGSSGEAGETGQPTDESTPELAAPARDGAAPALAPTHPRRDPATWLGHTVTELSPLDWLVVFFFGFLVVAIVFGTGKNRMASFALVTVDWIALLTGLALSRGGLLRRDSFANALAYRLTIFGTVVSSYFQLRVILPAASARAVDGHLYAFDLRVFGVEPSLAWDSLVSPGTTEWFSFFYFGYFFILALHVLPFMFLGKNLDVLARFALGTSIVFCVGHMSYILVPGYGPYAYLAPEFHHPLTGGTFWGLVQDAVSSVGAQKDIFPSLHTAVPTFFALFQFRYRKQQWPFRYTWPIAAFCALQIIGATMFLRWHYLIDILAGLALAVAADVLSARLVPWDQARRERLRLAPSWSRLVFPWSLRSEGSRAHARV
jgi:hypothetical protein